MNTDLLQKFRCDLPNCAIMNIRETVEKYKSSFKTFLCTYNNTGDNKILKEKKIHLCHTEEAIEMAAVI